MAMSAGTAGGVKASPNVTPMIDVMLVLLIIFMLVIPAITAGFQAIPLPYDASVASNDNANGCGGFDSNGDSLPAEMLPANLDFAGIRFQLVSSGQCAKAVACTGAGRSSASMRPTDRAVRSAPLAKGSPTVTGWGAAVSQELLTERGTDAADRRWPAGSPSRPSASAAAIPTFTGMKPVTVLLRYGALRGAAGLRRSAGDWFVAGGGG